MNLRKKTITLNWGCVFSLSELWALIMKNIFIMHILNVHSFQFVYLLICLFVMCVCMCMHVHAHMNRAEHDRIEI